MLFFNGRLVRRLGPTKSFQGAHKDKVYMCVVGVTAWSCVVSVCVCTDLMTLLFTMVDDVSVNMVHWVFFECARKNSVCLYICRGEPTTKSFEDAHRGRVYMRMFMKVNRTLVFMSGSCKNNTSLSYSPWVNLYIHFCFRYLTCHFGLVASLSRLVLSNKANFAQAYEPYRLLEASIAMRTLFSCPTRICNFSQWRRVLLVF
jgi:hypothetical protein